MIVRLAALEDKMHRKLRSLGIPEEVAAYVSDDKNRFPPATRKFVAKELADEMKYRKEEGLMIMTPDGGVVPRFTFEALEREWHDDIIKVRDWLRFAKEDDGSDLNMHKYQDWTSMIQAAEDWHDNLPQDEGHPALYRHDDPEHTDYEWPNGWRIVRVNSEDLVNEGNIMGHCVGGYEDEVESGESIIYSLRDPQGNPHVTFEIRREEIDESQLKSDVDYAIERAADSGWESFMEEYWPDRKMELTAEYVEEHGTREEAEDSDTLWEWEKDLESKLEASLENEYEWHYQEFDEDGSYREELEEEKREEAEQNAGYYCEQIQGKQDEPPLDRYRPYLREFFHKGYPSYDTERVSGRLMNVQDAIKRLVEQGDWSDRSVLMKLLVNTSSIRTEDLGPLYEAFIEKVMEDPSLLKSPTAPGYSPKVSPSFANAAAEYALDKGGAYAQNFVRKSLELGLFESVIFPHGGRPNAAEVLPPDIAYRERLKRILAADTPYQLARYMSTLSPGEIFGDAWQPLVRGPIMQKYMEFSENVPEGNNASWQFEHGMKRLRNLISNVILGNGVRPDSSPEEIAGSLESLFDMFSVADEGNRGGRPPVAFGPTARMHAHVANVARINPDLLEEAARLLPAKHLPMLEKTLNYDEARVAVQRDGGDMMASFPGLFVIPGTEGSQSSGQSRLMAPGDLGDYEEAKYWGWGSRPGLNSDDMPRIRNRVDEEYRRRMDAPEIPDAQTRMEFEASTRDKLIRLAQLADDLGGFSVSDRLQELLCR